MAPADELDAVYEAPLKSFTAMRDELARRARERGDRDEAQKIRSLKKPTVPAWTVNQLARRHRAELAELFDVVEDLEQTTDAAELRRLSDRRRQLLATLRSRAREILRASDHPPTASTLDAITQTLYVSAEDDRARVLQGRLSTALTPSGIPDAFVSGLDPTEEPAGDRGVRERRRAEELARVADEAEREARAKHTQAEQLRAQFEAAEAAAAQASNRAQQAREAADEALSRLAP